MAETAAIYLAHLNPLTNAHKTIISKLQHEGYHVCVFPVRFLDDGREINTKSFPFTYELRKEMVESIFGSEVAVFPDYAFHAPYSKYMPPLLSSRSWGLRNQIISKVNEKQYVSYTGDAPERLMLKIYRLNPLKATRLDISASHVKELLYQQVLDGAKAEWKSQVPDSVRDVIERNWEIVERFARAEDSTKRIMGMKFPREGYK